jgi:nucleoporin NUP42
VFGQPSQPTSGASPFGAQPAQQASTPASNPFLKSPFGSTPAQQAAPTAQQGQPTAAAAGNIDPKDRFKEGKPEEYEGEQGRMLEEIYKRVGQLGRFNDDEDIPLVPPKCEWIVPVPLL